MSHLANEMDTKAKIDDPEVDPNWLAKVIQSFDHLGLFLTPEHAKRLPTRPIKVPGEIRPSNKSLQQTLRSLRLFVGEDNSKEEIARHLKCIIGPIETFLELKEVRSLLGTNETNGGLGRGTDVAVRRRRDALGKRDREAVVKEMGALEERIRDDLLRIENVLWPRRMYVFLYPTSAPLSFYCYICSPSCPLSIPNWG
jgi:hypothetical protein